jgi:hypothetical protein
MNTNVPQATRPSNDAAIAQKQRAASTVLQRVLTPFEARMEKAFLASRGRPLLRGFCNLFERNLTFDLDKQSYVWGDRMRMNVSLLQAIESAQMSEEERNAAVFWAILFHCTYFVLGYQSRLAGIRSTEEYQLSHAAFTQAVLQQMAALSAPQPDNAPYWEENGYVFQPLCQGQAGANLENEILDQLKAGAIAAANMTRVPLLMFSELQGDQGAMQEFTPASHETFAQEMLNEWVAEFSKCNTFGDGSINGIRLMYFKSRPPRDASEAIMDCLQSKYPVTDDLALYNNKKLANDYFAPRKADPIEEKTGHIELFIDCSGSISAGDIGDCMKVFTDFFKRKKKKMTYGISTFDTSVLTRIEVKEEEDPNAKLKDLAILGGGGTDFRCIAAKIQQLTDAGAPGPGGHPYKCDLALVFTDLAGCFPDAAPCDFVWVTTTRDCDLGKVASVPIPGTVIYL